MSGLCKDCKWWASNEEQVQEYMPGYGHCERIGFVSGLEPSDEPAIIPAYGGELFVRPDLFGCTLFEAK